MSAGGAGPAAGQGGGRCCRRAAGCQSAGALRGGSSRSSARAPSPRGGEPGPGRPGGERSSGRARLADVGVGCSVTALRLVTAAGETRRRAREPVRAVGPSLDTGLAAWELVRCLEIPGDETGAKFLPCIRSRPL